MISSYVGASEDRIIVKKIFMDWNYLKIGLVLS